MRCLVADSEGVLGGSLEPPPRPSFLNIPCKLNNLVSRSARRASHSIIHMYPFPEMLDPALVRGWQIKIFKRGGDDGYTYKLYRFPYFSVTCVVIEAMPMCTKNIYLFNK